MKVFDVAQTAALADPSTILATIWIITKTDASILRLTDYDQNLQIDGHTYYSNGSTERSPIDLGVGTQSGNLDIAGLLRSGQIDEAAIRSGALDYAAIEIKAAFVNAVADPIPLTSGIFGEAYRDNGSYRIEINNLVYAFQANIGEDTSPTCRVDLGSTRCGINLASGWRQTYTLASVPNNRTLVLTGPSTAPAGSSYKYGLARMTSGPANGLRGEVRSWDSGTLTIGLYLPFATLPVAGNTVELTVGCDKTVAMCETVFNNVINFQGEPDVPGLDAIMAPQVTT